MTETVLEDVAHGGWVVTHVDGKVVFVSGGLPGERVKIAITQQRTRFARGHVVDVLDAHPERVAPPCPIANICGGCDWQHASSTLQRELQRRVIAAQLQHLAGIDWDGEVAEITPAWGWRTRMRYTGVGEGLGLRAKRSHDVIALPAEGCRIAASAAPNLTGDSVEVVEAKSGRVVLVNHNVVEGAATVTEIAAGREYTLDASGFWQVHPAAADTLVHAVLDGLGPQPGESAVDLYCGVGLFAGALASQGCDVLGVEISKSAIHHARRNVPEGRFVAAPVDRILRRLPKRTDLVVLDPPRKGAGSRVVQAVAGMHPRAIAYVACDPAALARDLAYFAEVHYRPQTIEAFDIFPQTHHVETVCVMVADRRR